MNIWPDIVAPPQYDNPHPDWVDPGLPDFKMIWAVARGLGYAVGLHGSMRRDCDLIAVPWADDAKAPGELVSMLCKALGANVVGSPEIKPHGRIAWSLQVDGWVKVIDLSVMPRQSNRAEKF